MPNNNSSNNNNNRGRFLLGRAGTSIRRSQIKSSSKQPTQRKAPPARVTQLSPLRENIVSPPSRSANSILKQQRQKHLSSFQTYYSKSPIANNSTVDSTGFSRAELHDLEESYKLFDVYGQGSVQVGDLRSILEVLRQEQEEHQDSQIFGTKYPHLETLLHRMSDLSDEETLTLEDYIQLMASTTISNTILLENGNNSDDIGSDQHFAPVFRLFDAENKGYISLQDLERVAVELGEHDMTRGELQEMLDRAVGGSRNTKGGDHQQQEQRVGLDEFTTMMTMSLFPSGDPIEA